MAAGQKGGESRAASLLASVTFHVLAGLAVAASSWWWSSSGLEAWKTHTVALVDAPLPLQQPVATPPAAPPKVTSPPKANVKAPAPPPPTSESKAPTPPKPAVKTPVPSQKPKVVKSVSKPKPKSPKRAKPAPAPQAASSKEARSAVEALRERQNRRDRDQQRKAAAQQQAASERVAALRDQLQQQRTVGSEAVASAGVQRVRLMAYQGRVQAKIEAAWILPLSAEQRRDLQATTQFQVTRSGQVVQLELVKPSGNTLFDASLLRAIRRASPLPALPDDYPLDILEVEIRFRGNS